MVTRSVDYAGTDTRAVTRADFIRRTYIHLALALLAFAGLETLLLQSSFAETFTRAIATNRFGWLAVLGGFAIGGWVARSFASSAKSREAQYFGLALYVILEAVIFVPLIYIVMLHDKSGTTLKAAGVMTGMLFAGLTGIALTNKRDFRPLGGFLMMGGFVALGLIILSAMIGFTLGVVFSGAMILLACCAILYDTSRVIHEFDTDQHVAAALELFASVALLLWYVIRLLMALNRR
jgi:FtsH-binding integral membrane protein